MSAIYAVLQRRKKYVEQDNLEVLAAAAPYRSQAGHSTWCDGPIGLGHQLFDLTPEGQHQIMPARDPSGRFMFTCDARLDNRSELIRRLGMKAEWAVAPSDADLIGAAYGKWGTDCPQYLLGDFAFAIWDRDQRQLFVARDPLGARDVAYYLDGQICVVASEVKQVAAHPAVPRRVNDLKIAMVLASWWHDHEQSCFEQVMYLPPAHAMLVSGDTFRRWRYWDIDPCRETRYQNEQEYTEHFLSLLQQCIADRLRTTEPVGVSMSGGIDSIALAALTGEQLATERLRTFSYVFDRYPTCDERQYIEPVVDSLDLDATLICGDDRWTLSDIDSWPVYEDFPIQDPYVRLPLAVAEAAQAKGVRLLLNGHYSDVLFVGGMYWGADMLRQPDKWGTLAELVRTQRSSFDIRRDLWHRGVRQLVPVSMQRWRLRRQSPLQRVYHAHLHNDLIQRTGVARYVDGFQAQPATGSSIQQQRRRQMFMSIEGQGIAAARSLYNARGIEAVDPFFDRRLVEFTLSLPADLLTRPPHTKWLLRQAMSQYLPQAVCWRHGKTTLLEQLEDALLVRERSTIQQLLRDPLVISHDYINSEWINHELSVGTGWQDYGYPLWLSLALELWLRQEIV